jgi:hypothetical protein
MYPSVAQCVLQLCATFTYPVLWYVVSRSFLLYPLNKPSRFSSNHAGTAAGPLVGFFLLGTLVYISCGGTMFCFFCDTELFQSICSSVVLREDESREVELLVGKY